MKEPSNTIMTLEWLEIQVCAFGLMWSKFCHKFYEVVIEMPLHKAKVLAHLRMHSMMVLKKSNDSSHLKFNKDAMMSS
jgi:hypothetical protein